jgi:hypothetical protein
MDINVEIWFYELQSHISHYLLLFQIQFAQTYQYITFEMSRTQYLHDKGEGARLGLRNLASVDANDEETGSAFSSIVLQELRLSLEKVKPRPITGFFAPKWKKILHFVCHTTLETFLAIFVSLWTILLVGVAGMMSLEGWTFIQSLYFSVFSMTTTGYGDFVPTNDASSWFCVFWLPFNILFLAIYFSSVGHYWVKLCDWNVRRVGKDLLTKDEAIRTSSAKNERSNQKGVDTNAHNKGTVGATTGDDHRTGCLRRNRIREFGNKFAEDEKPGDTVVIGMQSILLGAIHNQLDAGEILSWQQLSDTLIATDRDGEAEGVERRDMGRKWTKHFTCSSCPCARASGEHCCP